RDRRRFDHRGGRKARRGLLGPAGRRRHRELVRLRPGACVPSGPAPRTFRRTNHRACMNTVDPRLHRVTPQRPGGVGVPLATTLANTRGGVLERAVVGTTLTTRVARETPTPPGLCGALVVIQA